MEISFIPRWLIRIFSNDHLQQNDLNILISNILIISIFIIFKNSLMNFLNLLPHFCLFDKLIGVECPVCGSTRAFCEISKGNFTNAYNYNFAGFFVATFLILQIPLRLFSLTKENIRDRVNLVSKYLGNIVLIIIFINWGLKVFIKS